MASEADIIATLYFDSMDIYRKEKVKNPNTGITTMQEILKYSDLKCSLDKGSETTVAGETGTAYISAAYKLFCRPTVDIQVGDKDRKSTRLNSSHSGQSRMPSSA